MLQDRVYLINPKSVVAIRVGSFIFKLAERYYEIEEEIEQAEERMEEIMKKIADLEKSLL